MTRRRFIADEFTANTAALTGAHADHLIRVLRAHVGQEFHIATGNSIRRGKITSITGNRVDFELGEEIPAVQSANVTLLLAVYKFDRLEWAIEKCTELGVTKIIPVISHRTDKHLADSSIKRIDRWRRLVLQASEQSRRTAPPEISGPQKLAQAIAAPANLKIVLNETEKQFSLREILESNSHLSEILLAIGPEGGWTDGELQQFHDAGWLSASLGSTILRAETAAIAATAIVLSAQL